MTIELTEEQLRGIREADSCVGRIAVIGEGVTSEYSPVIPELKHLRTRYSLMLQEAKLITEVIARVQRNGIMLDIHRVNAILDAVLGPLEKL